MLTGGSGLIGKEAILPLLSKGYEVYALSSKNIRENRDGMHYIKCDLLKYNEVQQLCKRVKAEYLLHFAWYTGDGYLDAGINYDLKEASINLLKEFNNNGGRRAIFAGTCFEYKFKDMPLKETDELNPTTVYARCKNELREKAEQYCKENNLSFGWGRIFYVFGNRENGKRLTPYIINTLLLNKEALIKNGDLIKDYMYTKDIGNAFVKFLSGSIEGIVNICSGEGISLKDYASLIARKLNKENLLIIKNEKVEHGKIIIGNNKKLISEVGFIPLYSLDKAFDEIIN